MDVRREINLSRLLEYDSLHNIRDLGGMCTEDGRVIRSGKLIRSNRLSGATDLDMAKLAALADTVIDLRDEAERLERPDPEIPGIKFLLLPILDQSTMGITREEMSEKDIISEIMADLEQARKMFGGLYRKFVTEEYTLSQYRKFVRILMEDHERAVLWHCSGGKDRAGIAAVIVEEILGLPRETIIADYLKTNDYMAGDLAIVIQKARQQAGVINPHAEEALKLLFGAERGYIEMFYSAVAERYGDITGYLHEGLQLTDADIDQMQERYLMES